MNMTKDEIKEIQHFCDTGERFHGVMVTDEWVEESLKNSITDLVEGEERWRCSIKASEDWAGIVRAARALHKAWRKDKDTTPLFKALHSALNTHR